eukprot:TRINITY_DN29_c0_g1_i3.p1 TRINITY_DN29_c0_g1~~TRINITY_DN29_c0_g1_i3.p1  ORF type:complete len:118 (-),score=14.72 TRINITY_DN29_c0_g1_i3:52-405(-)
MEVQREEEQKAQNAMHADGDTPVDPDKLLTKAQRYRQIEKQQKLLVESEKKTITKDMKKNDCVKKMRLEWRPQQQGLSRSSNYKIQGNVLLQQKLKLSDRRSLRKRELNGAKQELPS